MKKNKLSLNIKKSFKRISKKSLIKLLIFAVIFTASIVMTFVWTPEFSFLSSVYLVRTGILLLVLLATFVLFELFQLRSLYKEFPRTKYVLFYFVDFLFLSSLWLLSTVLFVKLGKINLDEPIVWLLILGIIILSIVRIIETQNLADCYSLNSKQKVGDLIISSLSKEKLNILKIVFVSVLIFVPMFITNLFPLTWLLIIGIAPVLLTIGFKMI